MRSILILLLWASAIVCQAQYFSAEPAIRVYRQSPTQIAVTNAQATDVPTVYKASDVRVRDGAPYVELTIGGSTRFLLPANFLNQAGLPYNGASSTDAVKAYLSLQYSSVSTILATTYADAQAQCAALAAGSSALVFVASDESPGNAGTATVYVFIANALRQPVLFPN